MELEIDMLRLSATGRLVTRLNKKILSAPGTAAAAGLAAQYLGEAIREEEAVHPGVDLDLASAVVYRPAQFVDAQDMRIYDSAWRMLAALVAASRLLEGGEKRPGETKTVLFQMKAALSNAVGMEFTR